jgi:glycosyltransferase involved in cell wall biosynthesis
MPLFSVIIPCYNRAGLIGATLDSVLAQTFTDFEVVVVDDGSTDGTPEVVVGFGARVKLLRQANRGPGPARNLGIAAAGGEYVAFLDSDDLWFPWTLATFADVIRRHGGPAFIAGENVRFREASELAQYAPSAADYRVYPDYYASSPEALSFPTPAAAVRATTLKAVGGFTDEKVNAEDSDLWLRLGTAPGFVFVAAPPVLAYRLTAGSAISDLDRSFAGVAALIRCERGGGYPGGRGRRRERQRILTRHLRTFSVICLDYRQFARGLWIYRQTLRWNARLGRLIYLFGFPAVALVRWLRPPPVKVS